MLRLAFPAILIVGSIAFFAMFTNPMYQELVTLREEASSYSDALSNSKTLAGERDKLTQKYNTISPENMTRLNRMLPNSVDNIRLILEIEKVALPFGMTLRDVKYDAKQAEHQTGNIAGGAASVESAKPYGTWDLSFMVQGTYNNFVNFLKELEHNLRLVDVRSVQFDSNIGTDIPGVTNVYKFEVSIRTYWLKN
jgi:Tfp pilus assembly protein PilO